MSNEESPLVKENKEEYKNHPKWIIDKQSAVYFGGAFVAGGSVGIIGSLLVNNGILNLGGYCMLGAFSVPIISTFTSGTLLYGFKKCSSQDFSDLAEALISLAPGVLAGWSAEAISLTISANGGRDLAEMCITNLSPSAGEMAKNIMPAVIGALCTSATAFFARRKELPVEKVVLDYDYGSTFTW
jgi:hypothetical protein